MLAASLLLTALVDVNPTVRPCDPAATESWRIARAGEYTADDGWLSVAGLFFLEPGANPMGSAPGAPIALPPPAPVDAGVIELRQGRVFARLAPGVAAAMNGAPVTGDVELRPATSDRPADRLGIGRLVVQAHRSGERLAIRLRNPDSELRRGFKGLAWYPTDARWCVTARFEPHPAPVPVAMVNTAGDVVTLDSPGRVRFRLDGRDHSLVPVLSEGRLWFILSDGTAGKTTYKVRYLYAGLPEKGRVRLDLNRIHNPPCAVNPHTTCPLPPKDNQLELPIAAGERLPPGPG